MKCRIKCNGQLLKQIVSIIDPYVHEGVRFRFDGGIDIIMADVTHTTMVQVIVPEESFEVFEGETQVHWLPVKKLKEAVRIFASRKSVEVLIEKGEVSFQDGNLKRSFPTMGAIDGPTAMPRVMGNNTITVHVTPLRDGIKMIESVKTEATFLYDGRFIVFAEEGGDRAVYALGPEDIIEADVPDGELLCKFDTEFLNFSMKPVPKEVESVTLILGQDMPLYISYDTGEIQACAVIAPRVV